MALGAPRWRGVLSIYIGIAWASALLVLTLTGNAKASMRGTSDKHDSHAFFVSKLKRNLILGKIANGELWHLKL